MIVQIEGITKPKQTDPTPEIIRQRCWEIQAGWTASERRKRAGWFDPGQVEVVEVDLFEELA